MRELVLEFLSIFPSFIVSTTSFSNVLLPWLRAHTYKRSSIATKHFCIYNFSCRWSCLCVYESSKNSYSIFKFKKQIFEAIHEWEEGVFSFILLIEKVKKGENFKQKRNSQRN